MNFQWEKLIGSYDKKVIIEEMQKGIIGRKKEIQKIAGAFCRTENRQVVLLGADGSGRELLIRALGNAAGVPIIEIDMGGVRMEDSCMFGSGRYYENGDASLFFKKLFRQGTHSILWLKRIDHLHKSMEASVVTLLTGVLNDCFLEVDIPLNNTFIIATAEDGNCIPDAVMGKTEEIVLPEYNAKEKDMILKKNFEELLCMNGIEDDVQLSSEAVNYLLGASILEGVSDIGMDLKRIVENIAG